MKSILLWADGEIKHLYEEVSKLYDGVNLLIFGDHGQTMVSEYVDIPLEYPGFELGWDYLYLKSSAAIQFWVFDDKITRWIMRDPILRKYGEFIKSPSQRQGDIVWRADEGILVSPCHFHSKEGRPISMHGYQPNIDTEKGFAVIVGNGVGVIEEASLLDICPTICDLVGMPYPKFNEGRSLCTNTHK
jgi:bisphosphoglycerate-independent phosphoglycerate mutase (AlkP superfamily)